MVIGSKLRNLLHIKRLRLSANRDVCTNCHLCDKNCPMGLKVAEKVKTENMDDNKCILCGACVDNFPKKAIAYKMK